MKESFKQILEAKRKAHAADLKRTADNFSVLKKRIAAIKDDLSKNVAFVAHTPPIINFWFRNDMKINFVIKAGPFGFDVDGKYSNLDAAIGELAKWIAENEK